MEIGAATMKGLSTLETITEMAKPGVHKILAWSFIFFIYFFILLIYFFVFLVICDPKCDNGVCMKNNTCHCYPGYLGDRCAEKGYYIILCLLVL